MGVFEILWVPCLRNAQAHGDLVVSDQERVVLVWSSWRRDGLVDVWGGEGRGGGGGSGGGGRESGGRERASEGGGENKGGDRRGREGVGGERMERSERWGRGESQKGEH